MVLKIKIRSIFVLLTKVIIIFVYITAAKFEIYIYISGRKWHVYDH